MKTKHLKAAGAAVSLLIASGSALATVSTTSLSDGSSTATSNAARLSAAAAAAGARVYVTRRATTYDTSVATIAGSNFSATADMGAGTFAVTVSPFNANTSADAGIFQVVLTNNTGSPVTIERGALRAHFDGTYTHPVVPLGATATQVSAHLGVAASGAGVFTARGDHGVSFRYDQDGNLINSTNTFNKVYEQNGAKVDVSRAEPKRLKMDLVVPQFVLGPGVKLFITLQLHVVAQNASANFTDKPATIRLELPPGVTLDNDAAVPLTWVGGGSALGPCVVTAVPAALRSAWGLSPFYTKHADALAASPSSRRGR